MTADDTQENQKQYPASKVLFQATMTTPKYAPSRSNTPAPVDDLTVRPVTPLPVIASAPPPKVYQPPKESRGWLSKSAPWLIFAVLGLFVGILSSIDVISDYHGGATIQSITYHRNESLEFPAVTVCDNIISAQSLRGFNKSLEAWGFVEYEENILTSKEEIALASIKEDRNETRDFIVSCTFKEKNCSESDATVNYFHSFYNHYFGSCHTFNPGFKTTFMGRSGDVLTLVLAAASPARPIAIVHSSGSAPIFDVLRLIRLFPGTSISIATHLMKLENQILCDPRMDETSTAKTLFHYSRKTPYRYTYDACMATCRQKTLLMKCLKNNHSCLVDPTVPMPRGSPLTNTFKITGIWNPERKISSGFRSNSIITEDMCVCPPSCAETIFSTSVTSFPLFEQMPETSDDKLHPIQIRVFSESFLFEAVVEDVKYTGGEYWGLIGGNILFSIGISLLLCTTIMAILGKINIKNPCPQA